MKIHKKNVCQKNIKEKLERKMFNFKLNAEFSYLSFFFKRFSRFKFTNRKKEKPSSINKTKKNS